MSSAAVVLIPNWVLWLRSVMPDRSRSGRGSGASTGTTQSWDGGRWRARKAPLKSGSGQWQRRRSHGGGTYREALLRLGIHPRFSAGLCGCLRHGEANQRRTDVVRRRGGAGRRRGDAVVCWLRGWLSGLDPWMLWRWWLGRALVAFAFIGCFLSVVALRVIISNRVLVGDSGLCASGLCASLCTLCAYFALGRRRVPCACKWSLPLSSRVKLSVTGCSVRGHHDGKAVRMEVMLCCSRVAVQVIFPLCHRCVKAVKANRVASRALFASRCFVEYKRLVETRDSISGGSTYCNQGFRLNVPPLYSTVSLIKAIKA